MATSAKRITKKTSKAAAAKPVAPVLTLTAAQKQHLAKLKASARFKKYDKPTQKKVLEDVHAGFARDQRLGAAWNRIEAGRFTGALLPGNDSSDAEGMDIAFDNVSIPNEYYVSIARHDGEKRGTARGVADGLRLLSLDESVALYAPGLSEKPDSTIAALIADHNKLINKIKNPPDYADSVSTWPFAVGKNGQRLVLGSADETYETRVIEFRADGTISVIANGLVDWLESLPV